jgi:Glu-tRNA(Gln) amidotransferase subunit E-like FAD-binding protein
MVNRQTKRKQSKRLQTKKRNYRKKTNKRQQKQKTLKRKTVRGGNFNDEEIAEILPILKSKGFNPLEISDIMKKLHEGSQAFAGDKLVHLTSQINPLNKEEIKQWVEEVYPDFIADVETDYDSGNDY